MGDLGEGSSSAAQSAQSAEDGSSRGLVSRVLTLFGTRDDNHGAEAESPTAQNKRHGLGNLTRMRVEDVMLPKIEIVAVPYDIKKDDLVEVFRQSGLTRLPVYDGTLDTPKGLVHLKDFALKHGFNGSSDEQFYLPKMLRPLLYAPPSMPIGVLLQKMQTDRMHMALVIDEYGGVDGLVTIEDLIEQVIGEIEDEHDTSEARSWTEEAGVYLALARTPLDEFEAEIGRKLVSAEDEEEIDTLGGLVFMLAGRVPARGEVVKHPDGFDFEVVDADPRRIKRLRIAVSPMTKAAE